MLRGVHRSALAALALLACGCGNSGGTTHGCPSHGIIWLSWTIKGAPPSPTSCAPIDHLILQLRTGCGGVEIEPIPCLRGLGWEYDGLPEGSTTVVLDAVDARGTPTLEAITSAVLTTTRATMTTPLDLR